MGAGRLGASPPTNDDAPLHPPRRQPYAGPRHRHHLSHPNQPIQLSRAPLGPRPIPRLARSPLAMLPTSVNRFLFGPTAEERVKKWQQQLKTEGRMLDREIRQLDAAANKVKVEVKKLALKGDIKNAKTLAREVVRSNKQKDRLHTSQARMNSINMQLSHQMGQSHLFRCATLVHVLMEGLRTQLRSRLRGPCRNRQRS